MSKFAGVDYRLVGAVAGAAFLGGLTLFGMPKSESKVVNPQSVTVNLGFFANVTHAPALVGVANGFFQRALGTNASISTRVLRAGPEAMEALLAGDLDVVYVGPSPAINTYLKTEGKALRIISGVCEGGASLVATSASGIHRIADLAGKKIAVPQLGNTQDVSLRHFIKQAGLSPKDKGGDVEIIPVQNADTLTLFKQGQIDAAWVPEPWASRIVKEAGATRVLDERSLWPKGRFTTTVMVARGDFADQHPELVGELAEANKDTIDWMAKNPRRAHDLVNKELFELAGKHIAKQVPDDAWSYLSFSADLTTNELQNSADAAFECGYLKKAPKNLATICDPRFLTQRGTRVAE